MRLLAFGDVHMGKKTHGQRDPETGLNTRLLDVQARVKEIAQASSEEEVDMVLFGGDAFDTPTPTPTQQRLLIDALKEFDVPVVMVTGNHDHPITEGRSHALDFLQELENVTVYDRPGVHLWGQESGRANFYCEDPGQPAEQIVLAALPWPIGHFAEDRDQLWAQYMATIKTAAEKAEALSGPDQTVPAIGLGHFTAEGSLPAGSEASLEMSKETTFSPETLSRLDLTVLSHIHKHQALGAGEDVVYTSSPERLSFGEEGEPKGYLLIETGPEETAWSFEETGARPFTTIDGGDDPVRAAENAEVGGHVVRVRHRSPSPVDNKALLKALSEAHTVASIENTAEHDRERSSAEAYQDLTTEELLQKWAEERSLPDERAQKMQSKLSTLTNDFSS